MRSGFYKIALAFGLAGWFGGASVTPGAELLPATQQEGQSFHQTAHTCLTEPGSEPPRTQELRAMANSIGLRRFRFAPASTAEFTALWGGKEETKQALIELFARINEVFRQEIGVQLDLVSGFDQMIFTDAGTDPYTIAEPSMGLMSEAQTAFDARLGSGAYDLGMVFTRGMHGIAFMRSVCDPYRKGSAAFGFLTPVIDAFHLNLVMHEIAHQLGASHTFNSPTGLCAQRRFDHSSYEPGAGSTLMSYAGLPCEGDLFQPVSDAYFHARSLEEIRAFLMSSSSFCCVLEQVNNRAPVVAAPPQRVIPIGTPFTLKAEGSDPDGDALTYTWEQWDLGPAQILGGPDDGLVPLIRSRPPSPSPERTIPDMAELAANHFNAAERLPSVNRTMKFRVVARDGKDNGAWAAADTQVVVTNLAGAFEVRSHQQTEILGATTLITWNVAGTTNPAVGVTAVRIRMSTDGGLTYPITLGGETPNDGVERVQLPAINTDMARFKVEAVGNVFFAINRANQTIGAGGLRINGALTRPNELTISWPSVSGKTYSLQRTTGIVGAAWEPVAELKATNSTSVVSISAESAPKGFFRVVESN